MDYLKRERFPAPQRAEEGGVDQLPDALTLGRKEKEITPKVSRAWRSALFPNGAETRTRKVNT